MPIKASNSYDYTPARMAKIKEETTSKARKDAQKLHHLCIAGGTVTLFRHSANTLAASYKTKHL